ncbi:MAG: 2-C-methyl-D-erythritol 2,4-cyclodiphosphate synthase [Phycisphaerae bacterium]|nr:2-C-methyl-D-erythritol 2,4-cyclodiphosphate synthase [Phycisphaerae bacterium]
MRSDRPRTLIGHGYDLHRLEPRPPAGPGQPLVLGGVHLESDRGPIAHSDGDALLHAITDAILGALAQPDIGQLFPDDDPRHRSQDSAVFLAEACRRAAQAGFGVASLDATVILERPRLAALKDRMRAHIASLLGVPPERVNVKGKSHEGVDAVGEGRAVEVHAVVLLEGIEASRFGGLKAGAERGGGRRGPGRGRSGPGPAR